MNSSKESFNKTGFMLSLLYLMHAIFITGLETGWHHWTFVTVWAFYTIVSALLAFGFWRRIR